MTVTRPASGGQLRPSRTRSALRSRRSRPRRWRPAGWPSGPRWLHRLRLLAHLHWLWIPAAIVLEAASMAAFAIMLRRLLAAGGASVGVRPMLATAYAANALSVSVPLAGPELATAFTFRRFTRQGADAPLAGWSLLASGVVSTSCRHPRRRRRRSGVREHPGHSGCPSRQCRCRRRSGPDGSGHAPAAAARGTRTASRLGAAARVPAIAPARRRAPPDRPGLG